MLLRDPHSKGPWADIAICFWPIIVLWLFKAILQSRSSFQSSLYGVCGSAKSGKASLCLVSSNCRHSLLGWNGNGRVALVSLERPPRVGSRGCRSPRPEVGSVLSAGGRPAIPGPEVPAPWSRASCAGARACEGRPLASCGLGAPPSGDLLLE